MSQAQPFFQKPLSTEGEDTTEEESSTREDVVSTDTQDEGGATGRQTRPSRKPASTRLPHSSPYKTRKRKGQAGAEDSSSPRKSVRSSSAKSATTDPEHEVSVLRHKLMVLLSQA